MAGGLHRWRRPLKTLVVADDDPDYCYFVGVLLVPMADTVTIVGEAGSGEEALALVLRKKPDIVVADCSCLASTGSS